MKCTSLKSMDEILQIVGNENRRKILTLLSEGPHYISQIAKKLDVTQPAILKHLGLLQDAGLIESFWKKNPLGAARKYYKICDSVSVEIAINPKDFRLTRRPQKMNCSKFLEMEKVIKHLTKEINETKDVKVKAVKAQKLSGKASTLLSCEEYKKGDWNCENCRRFASLRAEASQIILCVSRGDIDSGLRRLTETINQLLSSFLPK